MRWSSPYHAGSSRSNTYTSHTHIVHTRYVAITPASKSNAHVTPGVTRAFASRPEHSLRAARTNRWMYLAQFINFILLDEHMDTRITEFLCHIPAKSAFASREIRVEYLQRQPLSAHTRNSIKKYTQ